MSAAPDVATLPGTVLDVRLVEGPRGVAVVVEGRLVAVPPAQDAAEALRALADAASGAAWTHDRSALEELRDPASPLYREAP